MSRPAAYGLTARGDTKANNFVADMEAGYRVSMTGFDLTPFAGLTQVRTHTNAFTETGAAGGNIAYGSDSVSNTLLRAGVEALGLWESLGVGEGVTPPLPVPLPLGVGVGEAVVVVEGVSVEEGVPWGELEGLEPTLKVALPDREGVEVGDRLTLPVCVPLLVPVGLLVGVCVPVDEAVGVLEGEPPRVKLLVALGVALREVVVDMVRGVEVEVRVPVEVMVGVPVLEGVGVEEVEEPGLGVAESVPVLLPVLLGPGTKVGVVLGVCEGYGRR
jgi:hypothetical protein